jgi:hypothetical protein
MDDLESIAARFVELLTEHHTYMSLDDRWMVGESGEWDNTYTVFQRKRYQKHTKVLYRGDSLLMAIEHLIGGEISVQDI